ncbi:MAG: LacI family DNA-binding transcriptional regulator [Sphingomonadaceae bacterium]|nr:LacI family DNA-binding transcriptional regulator [Sphingomonadaceae bacterium]
MIRKPTIDDVAAKAGVARVTVSRVLNNSPNVRNEVRERVLAAVSALGYQVNAQARYLASGSSRQLALVHATDLDAEPNSYYHSGLELGAMRACAELGYVLVTHTANPAKPEDRQRIRGLADSRRYDGVILTPPYSDDVELVEDLRKLDFPIVLISAGPEAGQHAASVGIDDRLAGFELGKFLVGQGHDSFVYIDGPADHISAGLRLSGFLEAISDAGLNAGIVRVLTGNFTFKAGVELSAQALASQPRPSAVVCANDDMAAGALFSAHRLGLNIPADVSITGFDDTPVSEIVWPPLTTVHQPLRQIGGKAVELLVDSIQNRHDKDAATTGIHVPFQLVERASTAVR